MIPGPVIYVCPECPKEQHFTRREIMHHFRREHGVPITMSALARLAMTQG